MTKGISFVQKNWFIFLMAIMVMSFGCSSKKFYLFTGTYTGTGSKGIYVYKFDTETGMATRVSNTDSVANPSYLTISGDYVYAVNETNGSNPGSVSAFLFNKENGKLHFINKQLTGGDDPCYVAASNDGKWIAVANYSGGSVSVFPVNEDGSLQPYSQLMQHAGSSINRNRQQKPHVHETVFSADNDYLFAPDLGLDKVMIYKFDPTAKKPLTPSSPPFVATTPGGGPRHFTFSPDKRFAYLIQELSGMIATYKYNDGKLSEVQKIATYPEGFKGSIDGAEIMVSPDGKFLYTSQRGEQNSIAIFSIDAISGKLRLEGHEPTLGKTPRNFIIDPTGNYLLVANQDSDNIVIFKRDTKTGLLKETGNEIKAKKPVSLQMIPID